MLNEEWRLTEQLRVLDADKARTVTVLNDFKNDIFYEFIGEEILKIHKV